jgi:hypothetical protein
MQEFSGLETAIPCSILQQILSMFRFLKRFFPTFLIENMVFLAMKLPNSNEMGVASFWFCNSASTDGSLLWTPKCENKI